MTRQRSEESFLSAYTRADAEHRALVDATQDAFDAGRISVDEWQSKTAAALGQPEGWPHEPRTPSS